MLKPDVPQDGMQIVECNSVPSAAIDAPNKR
jgi:hypothetical protein